VADRYLLESSATDGYLLEDGTGVLLIEAVAVSPPIKVANTVALMPLLHF